MDAGMDGREQQYRRLASRRRRRFTDMTCGPSLRPAGCLVLCRDPRSAADDHGTEAFQTMSLGTVRRDQRRQRLTACSCFDPDDIDAAFAELDARYLAGEAAPHAQTWSAISGAYAALNRHELLATTSDWINVDHRQIARVELGTGDLPAYLRATWDLTPELSVQIEAVHRLDDLGAVVTHTARGTSTEGVDAEWRLIELLTVEGDRISRCEHIRRGRPRRRACPVRRTQPAGAIRPVRVRAGTARIGLTGPEPGNPTRLPGHTRTCCGNARRNFYRPVGAGEQTKRNCHGLREAHRSGWSTSGDAGRWGGHREHARDCIRRPIGLVADRRFSSTTTSHQVRHQQKSSSTRNPESSSTKKPRLLSAQLWQMAMTPTRRPRTGSRVEVGAGSGAVATNPS